METLTEIVTARVDVKTTKRIKQEVAWRRRSGARVNGADITREALIEYFERKDQFKNAKPVLPQMEPDERR